MIDTTSTPLLGSTDAETVVTDADLFNSNAAQSDNYIAGIVSVRRCLDVAPVSWIQPGMLREGSVAMFAGHPGAGKTTFTLKLAGAIANGLEFLGHKHTPRPVLYLDRDDNAVGDVIERMEWLGIEDGGSLKYFGSNCPEKDVPMPGSRTVTNWVNSLPMRPVILCDSFTHFLNGGDENSSRDINALWADIRNLRRSGCSFIFLHHLGKGENVSDFFRGSTAIRAGIDFGFRVENTTPGPNNRDKDITQMRITRVKRRNHSAFGNKDSQMTIRISDRGVFQAEITNLPSKETLRTLFEANPDLTQSDFVDLAMTKDVTRAEARKYHTDRKRPKTTAVQDHVAGIGKTASSPLVEGLVPFKDDEKPTRRLPVMSLTAVPENKKSGWSGKPQ